jgi:hypothetical protein
MTLRYRSVGPFAAVAAVVVAACSTVGGSPGGTPPGASPALTTTPTPVAAETTRPTVTLEPSAPADTPAPRRSLEPPPVARLVIGGHQYAGVIGSYSWKTHGDAAPWLPADALQAIRVPSRAGARVRLDGARVASWTAKMARAEDTDGSKLTPLGDGSGAISFRGPATGSWVVLVSIEYDQELGDGAYYWLLDVR